MNSSSELTSTIAGSDTLTLAQLHTFDAFYTPLEERFERITRLLRALINVPVAAVTVLNAERQWFKSVHGWSVSELPIEQSFCVHTLRENDVTIVADTTKDARFASHVLVTGKPHFRFYAGVPLRDKSGKPGATVCAFDIKPRLLTATEVQSLQDIGAIAAQELLVEDLNTAQAQLIAKLGAARREAMFDPLTRVWNRRGAMPFIRAALTKAEEENKALSICAIDIDHFKRINDTYGHPTGDKLLCKLAAILVGCVRTEDIVCRYGGDEFMLILPNADGRAVMEIAERTRRTVAESPIRTRDGAIRATISIGCATHSAFGSESPEALMQRADEALMTSKEGGRNRVRYAS